MGTLTKRILVLIPAVILQSLWLLILTIWLAPVAGGITFLLSIFAGLLVIYMITKHDENAYKILWLLLILIWPVPGSVLYLIFGNHKTGLPIHKKLEKARLPRNEELWRKSNEICDEILARDKRFGQTVKYLQDTSEFPIFKGDDIEYFPLGEVMFQRMIEELKKSQKQIMAEYFIVESGEMWDSMVEIMAEKAKNGVEVRVMYDDLGSLSTYSHKEMKRLRERGIKCIRFNPVVGLHGTANYRDHRKMLIIDGMVAFSGGVNIADEYINKKIKYGHWKDIGFCIKGKAVFNYARMFSEFWNAFSEEKMDEEKMLRGAEKILGQKEINNNGYILSYYDSPIAKSNISNNLYIDFLAQATDYAWFYTPYLLLGESLQEAFVNAAKRGVDIRIITPGIPDKKMVFKMTRSYYSLLMEAGVRIFEYTPGFIHAKAALFDDKAATVGTVNLDYRSLFLHYENNTLFYGTTLTPELKRDFLETQEMSIEKSAECVKGGFCKWLFDGVLRILAPLC